MIDKQNETVYRFTLLDKTQTNNIIFSSFVS